MSTQRGASRGLRIFGGLAALAVLLASGTTPVQASQLYYVGGHADLGVGYSGSGNSFDLHYHFVNSTRIAFDHPLSTAKTIIAWQVQDGIVIDREQEPGGAITYVGTPTDPASATVAGYLGLAAGDPYWYLPADSAVAAAQGKPWLGFGSEELEDYLLDFSDLTWTLTGVSGPGEFAVWKDSGLLWSSATGASSFIAPIGHDHAFYGFSAAGLYQVTITVTAQHRQFGQVQGTGTYRFQVGPPAAVPEPSTVALLGIGGVTTGLAACRRRARRAR